MKTAIWTTCPGVISEGENGHAMRDHCWSCAPYWEQYPACPDCNQKLGVGNHAKPGERRKCPQCKTFVKVEARDAQE
mgnify:CR=1